MPTVVQLKEQAKSLGLKGYSKLRKAELVELIESYWRTFQLEVPSRTSASARSTLASSKSKSTSVSSVKSKSKSASASTSASASASASTSTSTSTSARKARGCVQYTSSNSTPSDFKKYSTRKSPPFPANECPEGMVQIGNDGNKYVVSAPNVRGVKRWVKAK